MTPSTEDRRPPWLMLSVIALLFAALSLAHGYRKQAEDPFAFLSTDDAMRMVQVLDLKDGAGWYDLTQRRLAPPDGVVMHWSRLPDLPLLAVLMVAEPVVGRDEAVRLATLVVPPFLGLLFYAAFVWAAAPLIERHLLPVAGLVCVTLLVPQIQFQPGHVDHHGWQLLLAMIGAGAVLRAATGRSVDKALAAAGAAGAMGLWIGTEAVPTVFFISAALSLHWIVRHEKAAHNLVLYATALCATSFILYPLAIPPSDGGARDCDAFSLVSLGLALALLVFAASLSAVEQRFACNSISTRVSVTVMLGGALIVVIIALFPKCLAGPYGAVSPEVSQLLTSVTEARPLAQVITESPALAALFSTLPVAALAVALWQVWRSTPERRLLWISLLTLLLTSSAMPFWQIRTVFLPNAYSGIAMCWLLAQALKKAQTIPYRLDRFLLKLAAVVTVPALPLLSFLTISAVADQATRHSPHRCDLRNIIPLLNNPAFSRPAPLLIASCVNVGPALLLFTPHQVLAAPYHRNPEGLKAVREIFSGDEAQARRTIAALGVDLIYICGGKWTFEKTGSDSEQTNFYDRLESSDVPVWLTHIPLHGSGEHTRLYRVDIRGE